MRPAVRVSLVLAAVVGHGATVEGQQCLETEELSVLGATGANFTQIIALEGDRLVACNPDAHVFERDPGDPASWSEVATIRAPAQAVAFGCFVALAGDLLVIGSCLDTVEGIPQAGAAYVYERDRAGSWRAVGRLVASVPSDRAWFGYRGAASADVIVVGAWQESLDAPFAGAAYVFERRSLPGGPAWVQVARLTADPETAFGQFGLGVALEGSVALIGEVGGSSPGTTITGAAHVFRRQAGTGLWEREAKLNGSDTIPGSFFGDGVALSCGLAAVGATEWAFGLEEEAVYLFESSGGSWAEIAKVKGDQRLGALFGEGVALSGDLLLVGAPSENGNRGAAYLFDRNRGGPNAWGRIEKLSLADPQPNDSFGRGVALEPDTLVVSAPSEGSNGFLHVYGLDPLAATVLVRNAGTNPTSFAASPAALGGTLDGACDLTTTGHAMAWFFAFESPARIPLGGGQTLLCQDLGSGELLTGSGLGPTPGPMAGFSLPVPSNTSLCGVTLYTQAVHAFGVVPFALSNAQDVRIGS